MPRHCVAQRGSTGNARDIALSYASAIGGGRPVSLKPPSRAKLNPICSANRRNNAAHQIEVVGEKLRAMMPWITRNQLVDKDKN